MSAAADMDREYLDAVRRGDMAAARRMVGDAAAAAGYRVGPVYHGSAAAMITVFDPRRCGTIRRSDWGRGIYFTPSRHLADRYRIDAVRETDPERRRLWAEFEARARELGTTPMGMSLDLGRGSPAHLDLGRFEARWLARARALDGTAEGRVYAAYLRVSNPLIERWEGLTDPFLAARARAAGHDAIAIGAREPSAGERIEDHAEEILVFDSRQIKSADPVAHDGAGGVVPLSRRFDPSSPDIRGAMGGAAFPPERGGPDVPVPCPPEGRAM